MEIKPETVKNVAYPIVATVAAATMLVSCQQTAGVAPGGVLESVQQLDGKTAPHTEK